MTVVSGYRGQGEAYRDRSKREIWAFHLFAGNTRRDDFCRQALSMSILKQAGLKQREGRKRNIAVMLRGDARLRLFRAAMCAETHPGAAIATRRVQLLEDLRGWREIR